MSNQQWACELVKTQEWRCVDGGVGGVRQNSNHKNRGSYRQDHDTL